MLWNWYTIDSCFLASSWKITSTGAFAGSWYATTRVLQFPFQSHRAALEIFSLTLRPSAHDALGQANSRADIFHSIGVVFLVVSLELLRRGVKEYDRFLVNKHLSSQIATAPRSKMSDDGSPAPVTTAFDRGYRPTILEQAIRA